MNRSMKIFIAITIIAYLPSSLISQTDVVPVKIDYDLYTAGAIGPGEPGKDRACYWINEVLSKLSPEKSRVSDICIASKDIYISGIYSNKSGVQPCYWKNGTSVDLDVGYSAYTSGILVLGNDVYVTGHYVMDKRTIPCYWKNGKRTDLEVQGKNSGFTKSITGNGKDFYIAGFMNSPEGEENRIEACYWKNAKLIRLDATPYKYSIAVDIKSDKNGIYIAGRLDDTEKETLCVWKENMRSDYVTIPNKYNEKEGAFLMAWESADYNYFTYEKGITYHKIEINSMDIFDGNVYLVGKQDSNPCYWINDKMTNINSEGENIYPITIKIINDNILIAGKTKNSICVWENGVQKKIVGLSNYEHPKNCMFIKK
ncbi:MAG: hypothetical protein V1720_07035 [bacterium]